MVFALEERRKEIKSRGGIFKQMENCIEVRCGEKMAYELDFH